MMIVARGTFVNPSSPSDYLNSIERKAQRAGYDKKEIDSLKQYVSTLSSNRALPIFDVQHLSLLVGYEKKLLYAVTNAPNKFYKQHKIPKRSGKGLRNIDEPLPTLKEIQRWVLSEVLNNLLLHPAAKAYRARTSIRDNARFHINQPLLVKLDIKDFFPSIRLAHVFRVFFGLGYTKQVAMVLSELCCQNNCLPQGAPTSGALSNLVMKDIDHNIFDYCKTKKIRYTRYADDMCFSGLFAVSDLIKFVRGQLHAQGFRLNEAKTAVLRQHKRQIVTGVVVNKKLQAPRDTRRWLRQEIYYIRKFGIDGHLAFKAEARANYISYLIGVASYIQSLNKSDVEAERAAQFLKALNEDYR